MTFIEMRTGRWKILRPGRPTVHLAPRADGEYAVRCGRFVQSITGTSLMLALDRLDAAMETPR